MNIGKMEVIRKTRLPESKPPWIEVIPDGCSFEFMRIKVINEHPFKYRENLVFMTSADGFKSTEVIRALIERNYIREEELGRGKIEETPVTKNGDTGVTVTGVVVRQSMNGKLLKINIKRAVRNL